MFVDKNLQLSGADGAVQSFSGGAAYSTDWVTLGAGARNDGLVARCINTVAFAADDAADTITFELHAFPVAQSAVAVDVDAIVADDNFTSTAHGLPDGTHIILTGLVGITGLTNTTVSYFVTNSQADSFQVAATPGGAVVTFTGSDDLSVTATVQADVIASSGALPIQRFAAGTGVAIRVNPTPGSGDPTLSSFVYGRIDSSGTIAAGSAYIQLAHDSGYGTGEQTHYPSGISFPAQN